jgi:hypothetical protein
MSPLSLIMIACAIIGLEMASAHTDTCSDEIAQLEALVNQSIRNPDARHTLPQSIDAQLHHQPTSESVGRAEEKAQLRFVAILTRAKMLNEDGKTMQCIQTVAEGKHLLGIN